jgi:dienelactone hydrolase
VPNQTPTSSNALSLLVPQRSANLAGELREIRWALFSVALAAVACGGGGGGVLMPPEADAGSSDARPSTEADAGSDAGAADAGAASPEIKLFSRAMPTDPWTETGRAFLGDAVDVRVSGLSPGTRVTVRAFSGSWRSAATFLVQGSGAVDLAIDAPESGSYSGADADGLFWSMTNIGDLGTRATLPVSFFALSGGSTVARGMLERYLAPDGATLVPVRDRGLVGVFVAPTDPGPHPALITFGGSEGGLSTGQFYAQYYASLGYACLGLAYFGEPGLPSELVHVPLEYFEPAIHWLEARPEVDPQKIGVIGASRGGELALLLGATYSSIKAVVANVPSGVVWAGTSTAIPTPAAWTWMGRDLPFIPDTGAQPEVEIDAMGHMVYVDAPAFVADLQAASPQVKAAATIPVERTNGPILMVAAAADQLWASCTLSQVAIDRLTMMGHAASFDDHLECYPDAGHLFGTPGIPTTDASSIYLPEYGIWLAMGGTPAGNAHGSRAADARIREFLSRSLPRR